MTGSEIADRDTVDHKTAERLEYKLTNEQKETLKSIMKDVLGKIDQVFGNNTLSDFGMVTDQAKIRNLLSQPLAPAAS